MVRRSELDRNFYDIEDPEGNKRACKHDIAYNMMRMWQARSVFAIEDCLVSPLRHSQNQGKMFAQSSISIY